MYNFTYSIYRHLLFFVEIHNILFCLLIFSVISNNANLNIPLADGLLVSIQPAMDGMVDPNIISRIDKNTLKDLRRLQDNTDMIMQCASNSL